MTDKTPPPSLDLALWEDELSDVPTWDEMGAESLRNADDAWQALPVYQPERSLLVLLRIGRRVRRALRLER